MVLIEGSIDKKSIVDNYLKDVVQLSTPQNTSSNLTVQTFNAMKTSHKGTKEYLNVGNKCQDIVVLSLAL
jgi:hypothetical protein